MSSPARHIRKVKLYRATTYQLWSVYWNQQSIYEDTGASGFYLIVCIARWIPIPSCQGFLRPTEVETTPFSDETGKYVCLCSFCAHAVCFREHHLYYLFASWMQSVRCRSISHSFRFARCSYHFVIYNSHHITSWEWYERMEWGWIRSNLEKLYYPDTQANVTPPTVPVFTAVQTRRWQWVWRPLLSKRWSKPAAFRNYPASPGASRIFAAAT